LIVPKIRISVEKKRVKTVINELKNQGCRVVENVSLQGRAVDYMLVSKQGVHAVKVCLFPKRHNVFLQGREEDRIWHYYVAYAVGPIQGRFSYPLEGPPGNANKHAMNNPVMEVEEVIKTLKGKVDLGNKEVSFHPVIVFVPKIKAVRLERKPDSRAQIVFTDQFKAALTKQDAELLSSGEIEQVCKIISQSADKPQNPTSVA